MNYVLASMILVMWCGIALAYAWNPKYGFWANLFTGILTILLLGAIHWIPFWLIFLR